MKERLIEPLAKHLFYNEYLNNPGDFGGREQRNIVFEHLVAPTAFYISNRNLKPGVGKSMPKTLKSSGIIKIHNAGSGKFKSVNVVFRFLTHCSGYVTLPDAAWRLNQ
jgi:hypothetical protein